MWSVLALLVLLIIGLTAAFLMLRPTQTGLAGDIAATAPQRPPDEGSSHGDAPEHAPEHAPDPAARSASVASVATATSGRIRGGVNVPPGVSFPDAWRVQIRPASYRESSAAVERTLDLTGSQREFAFDDLPLGNYEVQPQAEGMNAYAVPVELVPTSAEVYVALQLYPAGALSGQLLYEGGVGADGILVRLRGADGQLVRNTTTNSAGEYRFEKLPDGEYELAYGATRNPILVPEALSFRAPSLHVPARILAELGHITFEVVDAAGNPVEGAALVGSGHNGGTIDDVTNAAGRFTVNGVHAGNYRVWGSKPEFGKSMGVVGLVAGQHPICRIVLE